MYPTVYSRLGVADVVLLDCDVVAASNLNRQVLFSCADVGRRKVDAAKDALQHHNIATSMAVYIACTNSVGRLNIFQIQFWFLVCFFFSSVFVNFII